MTVRLTDKDKIKLINSSDVYSIMQKVLLRENKIDRNKEHFWIIGLATNNKILYIELISVGTVAHTLAEPMEIFSIALQKRSVKIILIHNHPSGELTPSGADKDLTDRLIQVGDFLKVPVVEHLIITETSYYSFLDSGELDNLRQSKKYALRYKEEERIRKEAQEAGHKKGEGKKALEIARELKMKGIDLELISEVTGLSVAEIKKLKIKETKEDKKR